VLLPLPHAYFFRAVNWLDHSKTLRQQGIEESDTLLLKRKIFFSDQNIDARDPIQLNLLYVQVSGCTAGGVYQPAASVLRLGSNRLFSPHCYLVYVCR